MDTVDLDQILDDFEESEECQGAQEGDFLRSTNELSFESVDLAEGLVAPVVGKDDDSGNRSTSKREKESEISQISRIDSDASNVMQSDVEQMQTDGDMECIPLPLDKNSTRQQCHINYTELSDKCTTCMFDAHDNHGETTPITDKVFSFKHQAERFYKPKDKCQQQNLPHQEFTCDMNCTVNVPDYGVSPVLQGINKSKENSDNLQFEWRQEEGKSNDTEVIENEITTRSDHWKDSKCESNVANEKNHIETSFLGNDDFAGLEIEVSSVITDLESEIKSHLVSDTDVFVESENFEKETTQCFLNVHCLPNAGTMQSDTENLHPTKLRTDTKTENKEASEVLPNKPHKLRDNSLEESSFNESVKGSALNPHYLASLQRPGILPAEGHRNVDKVDSDKHPFTHSPFPSTESDQNGARFNDTSRDAMKGSTNDHGSFDSSTVDNNNSNSLEAPPGLILPKSGYMQPPPSTSYPCFSITDLGKMSPSWMPDISAPNCLQCDTRFSFTRRRHHCRACGKIFCSSCCNMKCKLEYMGGKEARVCSVCYQDLIRAQVYKLMGKETNTSSITTDCAHISECVNTDVIENDRSDSSTPVNYPLEDNQTASLCNQAQDKLLGVEKETKKVTFRDGTRPGYSNISVVKQRKIESAEISHFEPSDGLPPLPRNSGELKGEKISFAINGNLQVEVKMVHLDCCMNCTFLVFTSDGLCTVGQMEVVIVLDTLPSDTTIPLDIFRQYEYLYQNALKGKVIHDMDYLECYNQAMEFHDEVQANIFLENSENSGFLFVFPTSQCLKKIVDKKEYLFGILVQKSEVPWAKALPLRLKLRLGAEFKYFPCPLVSQHKRRPVFAEIGHTVMSMLIDFQSYSYILPVINGFTIEMKDENMFLYFPRDRHKDFLRVLHCGSEHVFAVGAVFNPKADSHLVCVQGSDGGYHTEIINIQNKGKKVTGATFVIFSGALKPSNHGIKCKASIVEDGVMIQLIPGLLQDVKNAIINMTDSTIQCVQSTAGEGAHQLFIQWVDFDQQLSTRLASPIDGGDLQAMVRIDIMKFIDYYCEMKGIRLTEIYCKGNVLDHMDILSLAESLAQATCKALVPVLPYLVSLNITKVGLRTTTGIDNVSYDCGANGSHLPEFCTEFLDSKLIPVLLDVGSKRKETTVQMELIFHVVNV